jgi:glycosyltransferase involved in cell wall biosynthesis
MADGKKASVQVVYTTGLSTFVRRDIDILSKRHGVTSILSKDFRSLMKALSGVRKSDVSILWFATMTSAAVALASKLFRKPTVLILGGADVASFPEYDYGLLARPFYRVFPKMAIKHATVVLAVDGGLVEDVRKNTNIKRVIEVVPTGYDPEKYRPAGSKERMVLTVCSGSGWTRMRIKGIDTFIEVSNRMPDVPFVIVGLEGETAEEVRKRSKGNLTIVGKLPEDEVVAYYQRAKVYCQFSIREGLPNSLCEAMLCECVPVGTDVQGVRTAIGDAGYLVLSGDLEACVAIVSKALDATSGGAARSRVVELFSIEKREAGLTRALSKVVSGRTAIGGEPA